MYVVSAGGEQEKDRANSEAEKSGALKNGKRRRTFVEIVLRIKMAKSSNVVLERKNFHLKTSPQFKKEIFSER